MRAYVEVRGNVGFSDGDFAVGITNIATRQMSVPPLAFPTREAAQAVVDAITGANPTLYTSDYPWRDET